MRSTEAQNCRLLSVAGQAGDAAGSDSADEYDAGIGAEPPEGAEKWVGDVGAWYEERRQRSLDGGAQNVVVWRSLGVAQDLEIGWAEGDVVTFRRDRGTDPEKGTVQAVERDDLPRGEAGAEVRLTLDTT